MKYQDVETGNILLEFGYRDNTEGIPKQKKCFNLYFLLFCQPSNCAIYFKKEIQITWDLEPTA